MTGSSREFYGTGTNFFRYRYQYIFRGPIFSGTGTDTFFRDQIFPIPGPVLFSGTYFFRYRYRYFFPGPNFSGTGTGTFFRDQFFPVPVPVPSKKEQNSRDREFPGPGCHTLPPPLRARQGPKTTIEVDNSQIVPFTLLVSN